MSSPRDREPFDDRPNDGSGWQEPAHLGDDNSGSSRSGSPEPSSRPGSPEPDPWIPPGWDAPDAPERARNADWTPPASPPAGPEGQPAPSPDPREQRGGLFGPRRPRTPGVVEQVFSYEGDLVGAQGWALQHGWTVSDGAGPADAPLADLIASAPMMRLSKDHRPASVLCGRMGPLEMVAFDVVYASGRYVVPQYAVTAVPMLGTVPRFRLSPARFWKHRVGGLVQIPSGNEAFDLRWVLLAGEDSPQLHRLVQDPTVQGLLLGTDDGDEFWSGAGHVAAVRPDGHRPELLEHHARLLSALVGALGVG
jgi:hypothetical protein